ncbi:MAG: rhomboid family intramembrane serine protease [Flavobacteriales bacterium]|nr:rhomboid family intramembrane serine protease [Flavobacteriales bacterium]MDG1765953.1 rhomboid family intramembrane serine protease [Flavobacteriales bacterium]
MLKEDRNKLYDALLFIALFLGVIWGLFLFEEVFGWRLKQYGNRPRRLEGLIGILTSPLLHSNLKHIWGNTVSFFTLSAFLFFFYRQIALKVFIWIYIAGGILLWLIGVGGNHIGASGLIYGFASFLFFAGIFRNNMMLLRVSLAVAFLYGSIVWWVLPIEPGISWEGHLSGAIVGFALSLIYRTQGPQRPLYQYEKDEIAQAQAEKAALAAAQAYVQDWEAQGKVPLNITEYPALNEENNSSSTEVNGGHVRYIYISSKDKNAGKTT